MQIIDASAVFSSWQLEDKIRYSSHPYILTPSFILVSHLTLYSIFNVSLIFFSTYSLISCNLFLYSLFSHFSLPIFPFLPSLMYSTFFSSDLSIHLCLLLSALHSAILSFALPSSLPLLKTCPYGPLEIRQERGMLVETG